MLFSSVKEFKKVLREYEIKNLHNFKFIKNDSDKGRVVCSTWISIVNI